MTLEISCWKEILFPCIIHVTTLISKAIQRTDSTIESTGIVDRQKMIFSWISISRYSPVLKRVCFIWNTAWCLCIWLKLSALIWWWPDSVLIHTWVCIIIIVLKTSRICCRIFSIYFFEISKLCQLKCSNSFLLIIFHTSHYNLL